MEAPIDKAEPKDGSDNARAVSPAAAHDARVDLGIDAVTINSAERDRMSNVIVRGTVTCSQNRAGVGVGASVRQVIGRTTTIRAGGWSSVRCVAGRKVGFAMTLVPRSGKFAGGFATVSATAWKDIYWETRDTWHWHYDSASTVQTMKLTRD